MPTSWDPPKPSAEWHRLLAPLPADALIRRQPVGSATDPDPSSPIAGWEQFVIELSEGFHARRVLQVVTDGSGALLSAGDHVMTVLDDASGSGNTTPSEPGTTLYFHESVGGRFEGEGFLGTHWRMWTVDTADDDASDAGADDEANVASAASPVPAPEKRAATAEEARELRRLANEVLSRAGVRREEG